MREILFRGKSVYTGKWAVSVCPHGVMHSGHLCDDFMPETVGQFTGLTDKNGKKIFEGDICKGAWGTIFQVVYDDWYLGFRAIVKSGLSVSIDYFGLDRIEVLGNIHDNPELLEVFE